MDNAQHVCLAVPRIELDTGLVHNQPGGWMVEPDGFCAWGEERET